MAKIALLIGVSEYQSGLHSLSAAGRDVEAVRQVLQHPSIGGFAATDITTLLNPDSQQIRETLVKLFRDRQKNDTLLLYFSGHGVTDDRGTFYLTCASTRSDLLEATAIPADYVHRLMENSRSKQQVVVLDSCFSGAFAKGMGVKGEAVNLAAQLGGQGRAVLTSSSATEYSFEQKEADLSIYTRYWAEGLQTGAADEDGNGWISVDELHHYTSRKVRESAPAMQPRLYAAEEGYRIILAKAPMGDPQLEYRKEVEQLAQQRKGPFSQILLNALDEKRKRLNLPVETAQAIQNEVLRPYQELQEHLQRYEEAVNSALQEEGVLSQITLDDLAYFQKTLGLRDADVAPIHERLEQAAIQPTPSTEDTQSATPESSSTSTPASPTAEEFLNRGLANRTLGYKQRVIDDLNQAIRLNPNYAVAYFNRGLTKSDLGDKQEAIDDFNQAIRLQPNYALAYYNRGLAKYNLGDKQRAIKDLQEAAKLFQQQGDAGAHRKTLNQLEQIEKQSKGFWSRLFS